MADTINKAKLQLRAVPSFKGDRTPSPSTKLLLNHGKPNFTIQRTAKQNGAHSPTSPQNQFNGNGNCINTNNNNNNYNNDTNYNNNINNNNNNYNNNNENIFKNANGVVIKSTKFNGAFKPSNIQVATAEKQSLPSNGIENEATKVVLRRTKLTESTSKEADDENVPEFIRRQRRIQERLAKENVLDFENRRSGYFTHVMISPTSTNRTSFVETMSSPAIVPSLEIPPTPTTNQHVDDVPEEEEDEVKEKETVTNGNHVANCDSVESSIINGCCNHDELMANSHQLLKSNGHDVEAKEEVVVAPTQAEGEEEEVAKAIEEVNKAVAGESEDDKVTSDIVEEKLAEVIAEKPRDLVEEKKTDETKVEDIIVEHAEEKTTGESKVIAEHDVEELKSNTEEHSHETKRLVEEDQKEENENCAVGVTVNGTEHVEIVKQLENGHAAEEETKVITQNGETTEQNGHLTNGNTDDITISHTNGCETQSGATTPGVNFEQKTIVSFSKDLSSEPNNYPDTVKVVKEVEKSPSAMDDELQKLAKLKFEIKTDDQDVQVTPVLRAE